MTAPSMSDINIKRFVLVYVLAFAFGAGIAVLLSYILQSGDHFGFLSFVIPMVAALDTGAQYATHHKTPMDKKFAWKIALSLNWIHIAIQLALAIPVVLLFWSEIQETVLMVDTFILPTVLAAIALILFFLSWLFIRWGLLTGVKSVLQQEARKAQK